MATRVNNPATQHFDKATRQPLAFGQMFFYEPGSTTIFKDTYKTSNESGDINDNPVILDGNGFEPDIFGVNAYSVVLKSSSGVQQWSRDPVDTGSSSQGSFSLWSSSITYNFNDIVEGSDSRFYISIQNSNENNNPASGANPLFWSEFDLLVRWNENENYTTDSVVRGSDGIVYTAVQDSTGENPVTDNTATYWKMFDNIRIDGNSIISTDTDGDIDISPNGSGVVNFGGTDISQVTAQVFTASGTWTKPSDVKSIVVEIVAGGAQGGASGSLTASTRSGAGQGGGSGEYRRGTFDVTELESIPITIGTGGTGGLPDDLIAGSGGDSIFGASLIEAKGGIGGARGARASTTSLSNANGGSGGSGGDLSVVGGDGSMGSCRDNDTSPSPYTTGGAGGSSFFGGGGAGSFIFGQGNISGSSGRAYGSGGGGAAQHRPTVAGSLGGDGADGVCIITEYR